MTPTIFASEYKDPLTLNDFVEKHEHEARKLVERVDKKAFHALLENFFQKAEEEQIVDMTLFSASEPHLLQQ